MATFYVLPPRPALDVALGDVFARLLPGLALPVDTWDALLPTLQAAAGWPADVYLIPRDDLPDGEPLAEALSAVCGAEPGDHVVEVPTRGGATARAWAVPAVSAAGPAA